MIGACIIDGVDIATLGMFIKKDGDADFIAFPSRKEPLKNDWFEHDGIEVDFDSLVFEPKKIKVEYYLSAPNSTLFKERLNAFQNLHLSAGLREIYIREFDRTYNLQVVSFGKMTQKGGLYKSGRKSATIEVEYLDNNPITTFMPAVSPPVGMGNLTHVKISSSDLKAFGIIINEFYSTALSLYSPKLGVSRDSQYRNGAIVDVNFVPKKEPRKLSMDCTLKADNLGDFWTNYKALFHFGLAKKEPLVLTLANGDVINCYYTGMSNIKKLAPFKRRILLTFTLNFSEI